MSENYKTICNKCYRKTWYEEEQQCHCSYEKKRTCKTCGHSETIEPIKMVRCTGTLKKIDNSGLDDRFEKFYKSGQRIEVTYKWGESERFYIGKSTGWKPIWLAIKKSNSYSGSGLLQASITKITPLYKFK